MARQATAPSIADCGNDVEAASAAIYGVAIRD
jgi:hypothetical protein